MAYLTATDAAGNVAVPQRLGGTMDGQSGGSIWVLQTTDSDATVKAAGYISDGYSRGMRQGDTVIVQLVAGTPKLMTNMYIHFVLVAPNASTATAVDLSQTPTTNS